MAESFSPPPTTITAAELIARAGLRGENATPERAAQLVLAAVELLAEALAGAFRPVPQFTYDEWVLTVAQAVADRRKTPGNAQTTSAGDQVGARAPRDPLAGVRPQLANYAASFA